VITIEELDKELASLRIQRDNAFVVYHQAIGAIEALGHFKKILTEPPTISKEELEALVGGKLEEIQSV